MNLERLVREEGRDAAAEERIVQRVFAGRPLPREGYFSTDKVRADIRRIQGRKRRQRVPGGPLEPLALG